MNVLKIECKSTQEMEYVRKFHNENPSATDIPGQYEYLYFTERGIINLLELMYHFEDGSSLWEVFCMRGDLLESSESFRTKDQAEDRIKELLK